RHCAIRVDPQGGRVKDMGSGNGTFLNGAEIREAVIADGDVLTIGRTEVELRYVTGPAPGAPFGQPQAHQQPQQRPAATPAAASPLAAAYPGQLPALPPTMAPSYALG